MLYTLLLALSLAALGLTTPRQGSLSIGLAVSSTFELGHLFKRQDETGAITGLTNLISEAVNAVSTGVQCSQECTPWTGDMQSCANLGTDEEIGQCACGSQPLADMEPCGPCFGAETDVSNFADLCASLTGGTGSGGATSISDDSSTFPSETVDPFASSGASPSTTDNFFSLGKGDSSSTTTLSGASTTGGALGGAETTAGPSIAVGGGFSATRSLANGGSADSPASTGGVKSGGGSLTGGVGKIGASVAGSVVALVVGVVWFA